MWLNLVEQGVWGAQVAGSNPVISTQKNKSNTGDGMKKGDRVVSTRRFDTDEPGKWAPVPKGTRGRIVKVMLIPLHYKYEVIWEGIRCTEGFPVKASEIKKL